MDNNLIIKNIPNNERPIEKLIAFGADTLSNQELLAIILRCGVKGENILTLSQRLLVSLDGLNGLGNMSYSDITKIKGIKKVKGSQLLALAEICKRFNTLRADTKINISSPKDVFECLRGEMSNINQEVLKLLILNTKNGLIKVKDVFKGTLNSSIVHPREIYSEAIKSGGASIIICHNHPSGDPTPSKDDINITNRINECGKIIGIELLDHIIIGNNKYTSLKEKGII